MDTRVKRFIDTALQEAAGKPTSEAALCVLAASAVTLANATHIPESDRNEGARPLIQKMFTTALEHMDPLSLTINHLLPSGHDQLGVVIEEAARTAGKMITSALSDAEKAANPVAAHLALARGVSQRG